jgi:Ca2+/Na+ antiporter
MFLQESNNLFGNIIDINLQREINKNLCPAIMMKYRKIEFSFFEDAKTADLFNLMGNAPQETILGIFNRNIKVLTAFLSIIGVSLVFMQVSVWFTVLYLLVLFAVLWLKVKQTKETIQGIYTSISHRTGNAVPWQTHGRQKVCL